MEDPRYAISRFDWGDAYPHTRWEVKLDAGDHYANLVSDTVDILVRVVRTFSSSTTAHAYDCGIREKLKISSTWACRETGVR